MSGKGNVIFWLESQGIEATEDRVNKILEATKASKKLLSDEEPMQLALLKLSNVVPACQSTGSGMGCTIRSSHQ